jgi:DNA gyrase subunit A
VRGINRYGRTSQGVRVMNLREGDVVSAVALVVESEAATAAPAAGFDEPLAEGLDVDGAGPEAEALDAGDEVTPETDEDPGEDS